MDVMQATDAINAGRAKVLRWQEKFLAEWYGPVAELMLVETARKISGMDGMAKAMLAAKHPDEMKMIEQIAGGM